LGIAERPQHDAVDDAEDGGVGADAERERENGEQREAGTLAQPPERVPQVLEERVHPVVRWAGVTKTLSRPAESVGPCGGLFGLELHLNLALEDRAPIFVLGNGHATFDANPDAGLRRLALPKQALQQ